MNRKSFVAAALAVAVALPPVGAVAHDGATGVVKERMDLMEDLAAAMKSIAAMLRGKEPYRPQKVKSLAREIEGHGREALTGLFPTGSLEAPTGAQPSIWTEWTRFRGLAEELSERAAALAAAAENPRGGTMHGGQGMHLGPGAMGEGGPADPRAEMLSAMPPDAAFGHLTRTCVACHREFRKKR
jgi:cytochrome c556